MADFNSAVADARGLKTCKYLAPRISWTHFLLVAERFGGCVRNLNSGVAVPHTSTQAWAALWEHGSNMN